MLRWGMAKKRLGTTALAYLSRPAPRPTQPPMQWVRGYFPGGGVKRSWSEMLTTHPHLDPRSRMSYVASPLVACMMVVGQLYFI
jgi:hypothetical protein